jgi:hypothetical protein
MITKKNSLTMPFLLLAAVLFALSFTASAHAQNPIDMTSACNGGSCFNVAGLFTIGTSFPPPGMDNGQSNGCTSQPPCSAAYGIGGPNNTTLELVAPTAPATEPWTLTIGGVPFDFGEVNTTSCGPPTSTQCNNNVIQVPNSSSGVTITVPPAIYSTVILLGAAVNGSHQGSITINYSDGSKDPPIVQTFSDWCGAATGGAETLAVGGIHRINMQGEAIGPNCNLYQFIYPTNITKMVASITLGSADDCSSNGIPSCTYVLALSLKPPTYTVDAAAANPASVTAGSTSTATVTVNPQPGYMGTINLSCSISPTIVGIPASAATAPSCSLSPTSVTIVAMETTAPTTTLTFTAAAAASASQARGSTHIFYALLLPVSGLALLGLGTGQRGTRRKRWLGFWFVGLLLALLILSPACVSTVHLGNVGTPPGQYSIAVTGIDTDGLTQASNAAGTSNVVVVNVTDNN